MDTVIYTYMLWVLPWTLVGIIHVLSRIDYHHRMRSIVWVLLILCYGPLAYIPWLVATHDKSSP